MGLNATVFKNWDNLKTKLAGDHYCIDPETGEVYLKEGADIADDLSPAVVRAFSARLGNVAEIGYLSEVVEPIFAGGPSIICDKILYSGAHGGDKIDLPDLKALKEEIDKVKKTSLMQDESVRAFVEKLTALVTAAEDERNPIVF